MAAEFTADNQSKIYSFEAEQAVLGCILCDPKCFSVASGILKSDYFYYPQHQAIFSVMTVLDSSKGTIDLVMLLDGLRNEKIFDDGGKQYLMTLSDSFPSASNLEHYCKIVRDKFYVRTLVQIANKIIDEAHESKKTADQQLESAEQQIYDIRQGRADDGPASIGTMIRTVYDTLAKLNSADKDLYKGMPTGFGDFDTISTGLNRSDLVIIGARPAMGKTSFALNMARNVAVNSRKKVLFFSLEMSKEQLAQRVLASEARVPSQKMRTGDLTPHEWDSLLSASLFLKEIPLYFDDKSNTTVTEMRSKIQRLKDVGAVFVDYLQLMKTADQKESRVQEVSEITRNLKLMAKDLNIPVVVCAQLSRGTESRGNKSHRPQLSDLRESGSIEQDADIVVMLYREDYYQKDEKKNEESGEEKKTVNVNLAELLVEKNRHGPTGKIQLAWNPTYTMYTGIAKREGNE